MDILNDIVSLFLLSTVVTIFCSRLKLPSMVGFLLTGILCGPSMLGVVDDIHAVDDLSEIGVVLLLFTIGLELSGDALARLKKPVFLGGGLQILMTIAAVALLVVLFGRSWAVGVFAGCLVALSSSAIVLSLLQQRGTTNSPHGRLTLAILVFQDILVAPMLLSVPLLSGTLEISAENLLLVTGKALVALGGVLFFARFGLRRLMRAVVRTRSRELMLLTTLGLCLGMALLTSWLGMSLSLGAFLAGLLLARSEYSMNVVSWALPYRDVFMSLFFISVGMMLDVNYLVAHPLLVVGNVLLFILIKLFMTLPSALVQGYPLRTAIMVSMCLAQAGEFAFVLASSGEDAGLLTLQDEQLFLAVSIVSMMLTPVLIAAAPRTALYINRLLHPKGDLSEDLESNDGACSILKDHLVIIGYGVSGRHLSKAAKTAGIPYEILEMNPDTVARYRKVEPISYGDSTQIAVLEHLGVPQARVLTIVISDPVAVRATIAQAREINPDLYIIARTRFLGEVAELRRLGANDVVAEEFETSIEIFSHVLNHYLVPRQDIDVFAARIRNENYAMLRAVDRGRESIATLVSQIPDAGIRSLRLEPGAPLEGETLIQSNLRRRFGVTMVAYLREGAMQASPGGEYVFTAGDIVYLFGSYDELSSVESWFCTAPVQEKALDAPLES